MNEILPIFPLQLVAFPSEDLNLHIFEPRYRQMMRECEEQGTTFGIPAYLNKRVQEYGTELELVEIVKRYEDGKMDVRTRGIGVFRIEEFFSRAPDKLYAGAKVKKLQIDSTGDVLLATQIIEKIAELFELMNIKKAIPDVSEFTTFSMGHHVGFSMEQEYELLCIRSEEERQEYMLDHLKQLLPVVREMEALRKRVQMNGHFKDVMPPKF
ncbi:MAG: LON peptidase substrate-binding domain-containing protein [Bacteroidota bacterium]